MVGAITHKPALYKPIKINGQEAQLLFDTGATVNIINKKFVSDESLIPLPNKATISGISAKIIQPAGSCEFQLMVGDVLYPIMRAYVLAEIDFDIIIGHSEMQKLGICIDYLKDLILINKREIKSEDELKASICSVQKNEIDHNEQIKAMINEKLSDDERNKLFQILKKHETVFSFEGQLGRVKSKYCKVELKEDARPFKCVPYRVSYHERETIKTQIDELLTQGLIRKSDSEWTSPIILVAKGHKDGEGEKKTSRFCADLRKLNSMVKLDPYPIPNMQEVLDTLAGKQHFFSCDLKKGFWQLEVEEDSRKYFAFTTVCGVYEFNVLPFGFANSSSIYQRHMESIYQEELFKSILIFIDDIIGFSPSFEDFLENVNNMLKKCQDSGLKLNPEKCKFGGDEISCLGHRVGKEGIKPDPMKLRAVSEMRAPSTVKGVRSFLGLASFYRKFCEGFSKIARPICNLLQKDQPFVWGKDQQKAFEKLKEKLCSPPVLRSFDPKLPIILHIDACIDGLGCVLLIEENGARRVVAYGSRSLSKSERFYTVSELEFLALIFAIKLFRHYLHGQKFTVYTDHLNLVGIKLAKTSSSSRLLRWSLRLQDFDFKLIYRAGKLNSDADGLSRNAIFEEKLKEEDSALEFPLYAITEEDHEMLQDEDTFCKNVHKLLNKRDKRAHKRFVVKNNKLYNTERGNLRYVVPKAMVPLLLEKLHGSDKSCHLGFKRVYEKARDEFYWCKMRRDILRFITRCETCLTFKHSNQRPVGLLEHLPLKDEPWSLLCVDFVGPITRTERGNLHMLVGVDSLTKFTIARAFPQANSEAVVTFIRENLISQGIIPQVIHSDRAQVFFSQAVQTICKEWDIKMSKTSAFHSKGNGQAERSIQSIMSLIRCELEGMDEEWDRKIPEVLFALNTTPSTTTGIEPYSMLYGYKPRNPPVEGLIPLSMRINDPVNTEELREQRRRVVKRIERYRENYERRYNAKRKASTFKVGDLVYVKKTMIGVDENRKLTNKFFGPFKILDVISANLVRLNSEGRMSPVVHVERLRRAYEEIDSSLGSEHDDLEVQLAEEWAEDNLSEGGANLGSSGSDTESSSSSTSSRELMPPPLNVRRSTRVRNRPRWHEDFITDEEELSEFD